MRCLVVTKEFAVDPTSGGTLRTLAMARVLAGRYRTTVVSPAGVHHLDPDGTPTAARGGDHPAPPGPRDLATVTRYRCLGGVRTAGARLLDHLRTGASGRYDVGIVDHTSIAGLADDIAAGCDRLLVSMHNVESDLMAQRAATAGAAAGLAMRAESRLLRRIERQVAARHPLVVCTEADAAALAPAAGAVVARNGVFAAVDAAPDGPDEVPGAPGDAVPMVFSGALDWEPNVDGLVWLAERVWPRLRARVPAATLTVAGRRPGPAVVRACAAPGITLVADPPAMAPVLADHALGIVPLRSGGGSRIKILEYLAAGLAVVSTDVGASGLEDVPPDLMATTPVDPGAFADRLADRLAAGPSRRAGAAREWVRANYAWEVTLRPLLDALPG